MNRHLAPLHVVAALALCWGSLHADTFTTTAAGNWTSGSTWVGGVAPATDVDGDDIVILHDVTVVNSDIKLLDRASFSANGVTFTMANGNFTVEDGDAVFKDCTVDVAHGFNIQITTSRGTLEMYDCEVEVGQNFQLSGGLRHLENICLIVHENFQNAKGADTLINVCALIGSMTSGNFQNSSGSAMHIEDSEFHLPNGDFQNASNAILTGKITAVWLENGNFQNDGNWQADVDHYCVSGQVTVPAAHLPAAQDCAGIEAFFDDCDCTGGPPDCDGDGIPDDQEVDCDMNGVPDDCENHRDCDGNGVPDVCDILGGAVDLDGNGVPDRCEPGVRIYCPGVDNSGGGGFPCPCGNEVVPGANEGCANATGVGASLTASGSTSIAAGDLELNVIQVPNAVPGYFFAGNAPVNGGNGIDFENGLRCIGGGVIRLGKIPAAIGGTASFPPMGSPSIATIVGASPGDVTYMQFWYRDGMGLCGGSANMSNALSVTWEP